MRYAQCSTHMGQHLSTYAKWLKAHNIDVAEFTECNILHDDVAILRKSLGAGWLVYAVDQGQHSRENVIVVRKRAWWKTTGVQVTKLSNDIPDNPGGHKGLGNDRWLLEVLRQHRILRNRKRCHLGTHLNASIMDKDGQVFHDSPRTKANVISMAVIKRRVVMRIAQGYDLTLSGDFNWREVAGGEDWKYAPNRMFSNVLKYVHHGLDWVLYSKAYVPEGDIVVFPAGTAVNPGDHPIYYVDFKRVSNRPGGLKASAKN